MVRQENNYENQWNYLTTDFIYFDASQLTGINESIEIYDLSGKKQLTLNNKEILSGKLNVSNLNQGIYMLIFKVENKGIGYKKIIIE